MGYKPQTNRFTPGLANPMYGGNANPLAPKPQNVGLGKPITAPMPQAQEGPGLYDILPNYGQQIRYSSSLPADWWKRQGVNQDAGNSPHQQDVSHAQPQQITPEKAPKPTALNEPGIPGHVASEYTPGTYYDYQLQKWVEPQIDIPEAGVDTRKVVESTKHFLDEEMANAMGETARRFGSLGGLRSSGYMGSLAGHERKRDLDLASAYYKYDYDAAQQDAERKSRAREGTLGRAFEGWSTGEGLKQSQAQHKSDWSQKEAENKTSHSQGEAGSKNAYNKDKYNMELEKALRDQKYADLLKLLGYD